jgi:asparagine synthase (glutamine-hydrolysing)
VWLGHTRLAIRELSSAGAQPMHSASRNSTLVFNGEVYNHEAVRAALEADGRHPRWRGSSDTETLLAAIEAWGVESALQRCVGMFAFAVWDERLQTLTLARDRFGEKPLYYGWLGSTFVFASELKAIRRLMLDRCSPNRLAIDQYLRLGYVPAPLSVIDGIHKLLPGHILVMTPQRAGAGTLSSYWTVHQALLRACERPFQGSEDEAIERLDSVLADATRLQGVADVPIGVFLSGGIDSTVIAAHLAAGHGARIRTLTMGSDDARFDESASARSIAAFLGADHVEQVATSSEALHLIPHLSDIYDEPFADYSQIPTSLVSRCAREHVTVCLSGDGGDELFGGYNRYRWGRRLHHAPRILRRSLASGMSMISSRTWDFAQSVVDTAMPERLRIRLLGDKMEKLARAFAAPSAAAAFESLIATGVDLRDGPTTPLLLEHVHAIWNGLPSHYSDSERMMAVDAMTYLPDDILCKVDRAAMSVSLETRSPFLDHRVAEFAFSLPWSMKIRGGAGKHILRETLARRVPRPLWDRPKTGFGVPLREWLRGPLREWADSLLSDRAWSETWMLDGSVIERCWERHLAGRRDHTRELWTVLMLRQWADRWCRTPDHD